MAFHEVRFPDHIARGATGGPIRPVDIVTLQSGREERNATWANSRRSYDVGTGLRLADDLAIITAFWEARGGALNGFRFKDWGDYKSCQPSATPSGTDQAIGTGNGTTTDFQLVKHYVSGGQSWTRNIVKPVTASVRVAIDGVNKTSGWSVDTSSGVASFDTAPSSGAAVTAGYRFDVPVRFDGDGISQKLDHEEIGSFDALVLMELVL